MRITLQSPQNILSTLFSAFQSYVIREWYCKLNCIQFLEVSWVWRDVELVRLSII